MRRYAAAVFILVSLVLPFAGAAVPADTRQAGAAITDQDLNITGADIANYSIPSRYAVTPTLIEIKVGISGTSLPGPKGEMAASPRTIGFSAEPGLLALLAVTILAGIAGVWYLVRQRPAEPEENTEEGEK
jgi:hypothetical protein